MHYGLFDAARVSLSILLALLFVFPLSCKKEKAPVARPPVEVTVVTVEPVTTPVSFEFVGTTESSRQVEIRTRVSGFLDKRTYKEGSLVKEGQTMFLMDPKPFEAALQQAQGVLAQEEAKWDTAKANLARVQPLAEKNAVSKKDLDDAIGNERSSHASVISARGQVRQAELNLGYTKIKSPLTGLSSKAQKQDGSYLTAGPDGLLTYVAQLNPLWVTFSASENEMLKFRKELLDRALIGPKDENFEVELILSDGSVYPKRGKVDFSDPSFSSGTGTLLIRAEIDNGEDKLRPGQFVKVKLHGAVRPDAILVPQKSVMETAKGHIVWIVDKEQKAQPRIVEVGGWHGTDWFITKGLSAGERVVVDGILKLSAQTPVKIVDKVDNGAPQDVPGDVSHGTKPPKGQSTTPPKKSTGTSTGK